MTNKRVWGLFLCFGLLVPYRTAYAYLDPGTGSYLIQISIAGLLGFLFAIRIFWRKIAQAVKRLLVRPKDEQEIRDPEQPE